MRNPERIDSFVDVIIPTYVRAVIIVCWRLRLDHLDAFDSIVENKEVIREFWKENPDLRFSQVLICLELLPNIPGFWYYMEEDEILDILKLK